MISLAPAQLLAASRDLLSKPLDYEGFLEKLGPTFRKKAERRTEMLDAEADPQHGRIWQRLACSLMTLAPHAPKLVGGQSVQYFIADGRYRKQVFALEDLQDGKLAIYCPNILSEAISAGLLEAQTPEFAAASEYRLASSDETLRIDTLDGSTQNPPDHFKNMLGWNRKAIRITIPVSATRHQIEATEMLCAIAAQFFVPVTV